MAFDPITFSEVVNSKSPIGSLVRVVDTFESPRYISSGGKFDITNYPELGKQFDGGFQGDYVVETPIASSPSGYSSSYSNMGTLKASFVANGVMHFIFGGSTGSFHYKTNSMSLADGIVSAGPLVIPGGTGVETTVARFSVSSDGAWLFASLPGRHYRYDLSDDTLSTFSQMTIADTGVQTYYFSVGNGLILANYTTTGSGLQISSDGGSTFSPANVTITGSSNVNGPYAFGNGLFVAVGTSSTNNVARSADGINWTTAAAGTTGHNMVRWNPVLNLFITIPATSSGLFYTSPDGITWTSRTVTPGASQSMLAFTDSGACISSPVGSQSGGSVTNLSVSVAGTAWTTRGGTAPFNAITNNPYYGLLSSTALGNSMIIFTISTGGSVGSAIYASSSTDNGATWSAATQLPPNGNSSIYRAPVISNDGSKILMMDGSTNGLITPVASRWYGSLSTDAGATWSNISISSGNDTVAWHRIVVTHDDKFVAIGAVSHTTPASQLLCSAVSTDGVNWTYYNSARTNSVSSSTALCADNSLLCNNTNSTLGSYSTDYGATWVTRQSAYTGGLLIGFKDKIINAPPSSASVPKYSVDNGTTWINCQATLGSTNVAGIICDENVVVITLASSASFYYSYDGITFVLGTLPSPMLGTGAAIINGWVMIPSGSGTMYRTKDFKAWDLVVIGEDQKYDTMALFNISSNNAGTLGYFQGPVASSTAGYMLRAQTEITNFRRIPIIPSDLANTKWVIIAK